MCSSDDDNNSSNNPNITDRNNNVANGTWEVILFSEDGTNQTSNYSGYDFTFTANNVLTVVNSSNTMTGTWTTGKDDSTPKMVINFAVINGPFEEISEDWRILSSSSTKLELKHISGGDGSIDLLTFQKN
jgi:hypothetical protein